MRTDPWPCHAWSEEALVAYLDGDLAPGPRALVATHVRTCAVCQQHLATSRDLARVLQERTPLMDDPVARRAIVARVRQEHDGET